VTHVTVTRPTDACAFEPVSFEVDASRAGKGIFEISIQDASRAIVTHESTESYSPENFKVSFLPKASGIYQVFINYNTRRLPTDFEIVVDEAAPVSVQPLLQGLRDCVQFFEVTVPQHLSRELEFSIKAPSGKEYSEFK
jgi:hypothetical protein